MEVGNCTKWKLTGRSVELGGGANVIDSHDGCDSVSENDVLFGERQAAARLGLGCMKMMELTRYRRRPLSACWKLNAVSKANNTHTQMEQNDENRDVTRVTGALESYTDLT